MLQAKPAVKVPLVEDSPPCVRASLTLLSTVSAMR